MRFVVRVKIAKKCYNTVRFMAREMPQKTGMGYSAAYPTRAERIVMEGEREYENSCRLNNLLFGDEHSISSCIDNFLSSKFRYRSLKK